MTRAVLSAGSNIGDRLGFLRSVVEGLSDDVRAVSDVYATAPWGGVEQDDFYNLTLIVEGPRGAADWLEVAQRLEHNARRTREVRWGPRTLDVDVISVVDAYGPVVQSDDPRLVLPHPRAAERAFVLVPWLDVDADATLPTTSGVVRVDRLVAALAVDEVAGVRRLGGLDGSW